MSTTLDATNPQAQNDPVAVESEKAKLADFTRPNTTYWVEPLGTNKGICRRDPNGQRTCVKFMALEAKQMFTFMQDNGFFCTLSLDPNETALECNRI
ncbi:hypothetical protein BGW38_001821 [Lunasporangiospora selenospora]|uniref:Uncharacterized protein n=1 Tax=Lunasporangiospora selenospora TaxID=979761 RepID=A0A9P6G473_9FUNG|nr:hypothetical protein BGW38_001821 [Lunasporangiospora selenospora]